MNDSQVKRIAISLHIDTGNVIYEEFEDLESAMEFVWFYSNNPKAILERITPGGRKSDQEQ